MIKENGRWSRGWINPETARGTLSLSGARVEKYKNSMWNTFTFWSKGWKNTKTAYGSLSLSGAGVDKYRNSTRNTFTFWSQGGQIQKQHVDHFHFQEQEWKSTDKTCRTLSLSGARVDKPRNSRGSLSLSGARVDIGLWTHLETSSETLFGVWGLGEIIKK